ncbi:MAG: hypothetical protein KC442_02575 [Thermomicrobiales bacterium]|nr:hypothetical protein [Thermomicrobiales bacterium]
MSEARTAPEHFPARVFQYGRDEALPERRTLHAGPLTAVLESGDLRYVRLGDDLVVLRLYAAVRDHNWNTIEPRYTRYEVEDGGDHFTVRYTAEHVTGDIDFVWDGVITGSADGVIRAEMDGRARRDFLKNRIGWCVLHPMTLAGVPASTETPDGIVNGQFPDLISPHQPFFDMQAITHGTPSGGEVTIAFTGDLFEMEDQRNWTDASYKTYSTPLRLPYPAPITSGDRVQQSVTISGRGGSVATETGQAPVAVTVDIAHGTPLPPIGIGAAGHGEQLNERELALLRAVRPAHLHVVLDLGMENWPEKLDTAITQAFALDAALELEVTGGPGASGWEALAHALGQSAVPVARAFVYPAGKLESTAEELQAAREALAAAGVSTTVGGGARAYFTELNRATLPLSDMDVVAYTINPQVHAFDNASLTETLGAQAETVRSARAIAGERPIAVGPVTLAPRFNPNATGAEAPLPEGALPPSVDYRQPSLFAAAWLTGSINALANAGADALTYFETTGWKGLIERSDHPLRVPAFHSWPGMVFPVYHVMADVAEFADGEVLPVQVSDPLRVRALALRDGSRVRLLLSNTDDAETTVTLEVPGLANVSQRALNAGTAFVAGSDPDTFRRTTLPAPDATQHVLTLRPFGLVTLDGILTT